MKANRSKGFVQLKAGMRVNYPAFRQSEEIAIQFQRPFIEDLVTYAKVTYALNDFDKTMASDRDPDVGCFDFFGRSRRKQVFEVVLT